MVTHVSIFFFSLSSAFHVPFLYIGFCMVLRLSDKAWILRPLNTLVSGARPMASGVDTLATLAAEEVLKTLSELGPGPITLHCLGHSMGGLALRGALPRILDGAPRLTPGVFMTLSTPHLGVLASWGEPQARDHVRSIHRGRSRN